MMKKFWIAICMSMLVCGCASEKNRASSKLTIEEVLAKGDYTIVDVRTNEEYEEGHVVGSVNIPYDEIDENVDLDKDKTVIVYCRSGARSSVAYKTLIELGFEVIDLGAYDSIELDKE